MTPSEAFVETLVAQGVNDVFGIVGSAYMDALDLFPLAGIRFISVAHEQGGGHMADGYARVSGRHGVCIAQNGPGITNFVTSTAAAFWAHSPVVVVTPETGSDDARPRRLPGDRAAADLLEDHQVPGAREQPRADGRAHRRARSIARMLEMGPTQLNIPRDFFYGDIECEIPRPIAIERGAGGETSLDEAAALLAEAQFPVILAGGGIVMGDAQAEAVALAELLQAPVCASYLHNDAFPARHPLWCGPLGYQGSQGGDEAHRQGRRRAGARHATRTVRHVAAARLDYWPKDAKIIQVDADPRRCSGW